MTVTDPVAKAVDAWRVYISTISLPEECKEAVGSFTTSNKEVEQWYREKFWKQLDRIQNDSKYFLGNTPYTTGTPPYNTAVVESLMRACDAVLHPRLQPILARMRDAVKGFAAGAAPVDVLSEMMTEDDMKELRKLLKDIELRYDEFDTAAKKVSA
jgi:hypothetical protein